MVMEFEPKKLSYSKINDLSWEFLKQKNRHLQIPIPIEEIAEFDLGLNIIPINRLRADFDTEGFISSSFEDLYVDQDTYEKIATRYRFTIAHEIGHLVLHKDIFEQFSFSSIEEWKQFVSETDDEQRSWLEYQGYSFAGCILVPSPHLKKSFEEAKIRLESKITKAKNERIDRKTLIDFLLDQIAAEIAPFFDVSIETVKKRLSKENYHERIL